MTIKQNSQLKIAFLKKKNTTDFENRLKHRIYI